MLLSDDHQKNLKTLTSDQKKKKNDLEKKNKNKDEEYDQALDELGKLLHFIKITKPQTKEEWKDHVEVVRLRTLKAGLKMEKLMELDLKRNYL